MPLLDHFHPPLHPLRSWESFHAIWTVVLVENLNRRLPESYFAETQVHFGRQIEVDVAGIEKDREELATGNGPAGGVALEVWAPPTTKLIMPTAFSDEIEVLVRGGPTGGHLVAAIEFVSPANKDRPETRRTFTAKCATYLSQRIGVVIVDVVTEKHFNLHNELIDLLRQEARFAMPEQTFLYASAFRPARRKEGDQIDLWLHPLALGQPLPTVPLAIRGGPVMPVDLEATYSEARQRSRL